MAEEKTLKSRIMLATNTYANWVANETVPKLGEFCIVVDADGVAGKAKIGDGIHTFTQLPWWGGGSSGIDTYVSGAAFQGNTLSIEQEKTDIDGVVTPVSPDVTVDIPNANSSASGLMTSAQVNKLAGIAAGANVGYRSVVAGTTTASATTASNSLTVAASGSAGVSLSGNTLTVSATDTKNTVGATTSNSKLYIAGTTATGANPQSYVNTNAYVNAGALYSEGSKAVTTANVTSILGDSTTNTLIPNSGAVKTYVTDLLDDITGIDFQVVAELPTTGVKGVIYLVSHGGAAPEVYDEYIWLSESSNFEKIGTTEVDLSNYAEFTDFTASGGLSVSAASGKVTYSHSNSITAGTASGTNASVGFGGKIEIPSITYDAQGHITSVAMTTATLPSSVAQWAQNYYTTAATYTSNASKGTVSFKRTDNASAYSVDLTLADASNVGLMPGGGTTAITYTPSVTSGTKLGELKTTAAGGAVSTVGTIYGPASLKNPNTLTLSANGSSASKYDGSAAVAVNLTGGVDAIVTTSGSSSSLTYSVGIGQTYDGGKPTATSDTSVADVLILDGRF